MNSQADDFDRVLFFLVLRQAVRRGLPLSAAIRSIGEHNGRATDQLEAIAAELDSGLPLSEVIERRPVQFPAPLGALLAVGETSARLDETLDRCVRLLRRRAQANAHLGAALIYPSICLALLGVLLMLNVWLDPLGVVVEMIREVDPSSTVHGATPIYRWIAAALLLVGLGGWTVGRRNPERVDRIRLDLPITGRLHRLAAAVGFMRALSAMLERGAGIGRAIEAAIPCVPNAWVRAELRARLCRVEDGESLAAHLSLPGLFPPSVRWRLAVGESHGGFPKALARAATALEEELMLYSQRVARMIEPVGILCVGAVALILTYLLFSRMNVVLQGGWF